MKINNKNILTLVAAAFLLVALVSGLPYGYFTLMRFVVCAIAVYLAYTTYENKKDSLWVWTFGGIAILFNPIIIIHLTREVWWPIDLVVGIVLLISISLLKYKAPSTPKL